MALGAGKTAGIGMPGSLKRRKYRLTMTFGLLRNDGRPRHNCDSPDDMASSRHQERYWSSIKLMLVPGKCHLALWGLLGNNLGKPDGRLRAPRDIQLLKDRAEIIFYCFSAQAERFADFLVGFSLGNQQ